ncbi:MAG: hypothetical protein LBC56_07795, partial [Oscillospiraceae bacterium]|nr:hypothetical protein [Oscillospiraceae bacterium]
MAKRILKKSFFSGAWEEYETDTEALSLQQKIYRLSDLDLIIKKNEGLSSRRWAWLALPAIVLPMSILVFNVPKSNIWPLYAIPVLAGIVILTYIGQLILDTNIGAKGRWWKPLAVSGLLWLAWLFWPDVPGGSYGLNWILTALSAVASFSYIALAGLGSGEILGTAKAEKKVLLSKAYSGVDSEKLLPEKIETSLDLAPGEIALFETNAVLTEVQDFNPAGGFQPGDSKNLNSARNFVNSFKVGYAPVDEKINKYKDSALGIIGNVEKFVAPLASYGQQQQTAAVIRKTPPKEEASGRLIITQKRIVFTGPWRFQIPLADLLSCGENKGQLVLQSKTGIR